jgi:hypothetical protein
MSKNATRALEAGIYTWIADNQELVKVAQELSALTVNLGLCDTNIHNPFQIVPKDEFSTNGNLKHELFLNIDHPAWGYFKITINSLFSFEMLPPKLTLLNKTIYINEKEVKDFIEYLSSTLDDLYELQEHIEEKKIEEANLLLDKMLKQYKDDVLDHLSHIKNYINSLPADIYIKATNSDDKQKLDINSRYDLALSHSENWFIKNYGGILSQKAAQEELRCKILDYFITESQSAAFLYVAQKLIKESGFRMIVHTDSNEPETDLTGEVLYDNALKITLVRPVIHATKLEVLG